MTATFPMFSIFKLKQTLGAAFAQLDAPTTQVNSEGDNTHPERAFLRELMFHNPGAIQSDLGLMEMMSQYHRQF